MRRPLFVLLGFLAVGVGCGGPKPTPRSVEWQLFGLPSAGRHTGLCLHASGRIVALRGLRADVWSKDESGRPMSSPPRLGALSKCLPDETEGPLGEVAGGLGGGWRFDATTVFVSRGETFELVRRLTGPLTDACTDGRRLLVVGPLGLFSVPLKTSGEPRPILLPPGLSGRGLTAIFRDGPSFWLRDADNTGWPVQIIGDEAVLLTREGTLPKPDDALRVPLYAGRVEANQGTDGLRILDDSGLLVSALPLERVRGLLAVDGGATLLVASGSKILPFVSGRGPKLSPRPPIELTGEVRRMLNIGDDTVYVVGDFGLVRLRRRP